MNYKRYTLGLVIGFLLFGCNSSPAPDVLDLLMPQSEDFAVQRIQHKSVLVPDKRGVGAQSPEDMAVLTAQNIQSSAYFKYWLGQQHAYKVRINVYSDVAARRVGWAKRYPANTLVNTRALGLGDVSFLQGERIGAFATRNALVEISSSKGAPDLERFIRAYAAFVESRY